jgi:hypothetical protein
VRVDPELEHSVETDGVLGRCGIEEGSLVFRYRRQIVARVNGPKEKLMLLETLLGEAGRLTAADLIGTEVPRSIETFKVLVEGSQVEVEARLAEGRTLVEATERLVCALYAVPTDLENEVVAHAIARSKAAAAKSD